VGCEDDVVEGFGFAVGEFKADTAGRSFVDGFHRMIEMDVIGRKAFHDSVDVAFGATGEGEPIWSCADCR